MTKPAASSADIAQYRVLVVDDEPMILELVIVVLEQNLAVVCDTAVSAAEAMDRLQANKYHALLTDFSMSGASGAELVLSARKLRPDLVCGLLSGHVGPAVLQNLPADVFFLAKPFSVQQLVDEVRQAMTGFPAD